jgi:hypothetical protein
VIAKEKHRSAESMEMKRCRNTIIERRSAYTAIKWRNSPDINAIQPTS